MTPPVAATPPSDVSAHDAPEDRERLSVVPQTLLEWVKQTELEVGISTGDVQRIKELEREVKELRRANGILKVASAFFA